MNRREMLDRVRARKEPWDMIIIGGGSTGVGCAVDAASRGFDVLLLEQNDFGKGTSSRSTKLVHGGVRYLEQGNISLVREALAERGILEKNAPHLVKRQTFTIPCYSLWQMFYFGIGLKFYDQLAGKYSFGRSQILSKEKAIANLPNIEQKGLKGGVVYYDGQFDDTRLLIDLAKTATTIGATILNYTKVFGLTKDLYGSVNGTNFECAETGELFIARAKVIINATGVFCDDVRNMSDKTSGDLITPSQGIHLVFDRSFLKSDSAIMIPKTSDGRVLFAIPWHDKTLVGTTDTPIESATLEPKPLEDEISFILDTCKKYLVESPTRKDVLSVFVGIRPLVKSSGANNTATLSRDHTINIDNSNLLTITGGKWTTYRRMAEDAINKSLELAKLSPKKSVTRTMPIANEMPVKLSKLIQGDPKLSRSLHPDFKYTLADVVNAIRNEMARTLEDVLARRTRILFLDAQAAKTIAPTVAKIMAAELGRDKAWIKSQIAEFEELVENYLI